MYNFKNTSHYINGDKMKENELNVLDELNKGSCMGVDAINFILDKVEDNDFKKVLSDQKDEYEKMTDKIGNLYKEYSNDDPHETSGMTKAMTWMNVETRTMTDHTTSKLAELMLQGTNMGIIEGRRLLNNKSGNEKVDQLVEEYVNMQEKFVEILKKYL